MNTEGYSIKDLEVISGIKMHTIRIWEKRYDLLKPERTDTNIRLYSDDDLRRLLNISVLTKNGYKISKIAGWEDADIRETVIRVTTGKTSYSDYLERFMLLLVDLDITGFENLLDEVLESLSFEEAFFNVFFRLFERVGTYWQVGSIFPAQEHYVTALFRQKLIAAIDKLPTAPRSRPIILFYLPENELHEISLLFYSYLAKKRNYRIFYLGQSVPFEDLEKINSAASPEFIFTAFVNSIEKEQLEEYLAKLKECFQKQKIFITGGQVQDHAPSLPRNVKSVKDYREFIKYIG